MGRLRDLLNNNGGGDYFDDWQNVKAAGEFGEPVPPGKYPAKLTRGTAEPSKLKGTPGYVLEFAITEGEHKNRRLWYVIWFTPRAKAQAKRDLDKLLITDPQKQLDGPLPDGIHCELDVVVHKSDDGNRYNKVRSFTVVKIEPPAPNPFAPADDEATEGDE